VVLRFPLGSLARVAWTSMALLGATARLMTRRSDRHAWKQAFGVHSPLVILLAAVPGLGAFAYLAARPVLANRLLLRVTLDATLRKAPWRLYEHSRLRRLIALPSARQAAPALAVARQLCDMAEAGQAPPAPQPQTVLAPALGAAHVPYAHEPWQPADAA
jgi:hypothetical protein